MIELGISGVPCSLSETPSTSTSEKARRRCRRCS